MNYSFEYIDIILLAMIAGFIFLRLRGILGRKTGYEEDVRTKFPQDVADSSPSVKLNSEIFDDQAKEEFLKGAKVAYETIVTNFANGKLKEIKSLLHKNIYEQFNDSIKDRNSKNIKSETTFIGINSATIKEHQQNKNMIEVAVEFESEIISCTKDENNKIISGDPEKVKKVHDIWKFSKDSRSHNPNWFLIDTQA